MRRSLLATEVSTTLLALVLALWLGWDNIPVPFLSIGIAALLSVLMLGRATFKKDRTIAFDPAIKGSSELIALFFNHGWNVFALGFGQTHFQSVVLIASVQVVYVISRSWAKKNTIRPTFIS